MRRELTSMVDSAARRAAHDGATFRLLRRGAKLALVTGVREWKDRVYHDHVSHDLGSSGRARRLEHAFHEWIERVPDLARHPVVALGMVVRYDEHLDGLRREFEFWLERMPGAQLAAVLRLALERFDAALAVAHRRMGRRWR